ncbi:MAG: S8 family serine peptidase [Acidobacteriota bacterium]
MNSKLFRSTLLIMTFSLISCFNLSFSMDEPISPKISPWLGRELAKGPAEMIVIFEDKAPLHQLPKGLDPISRKEIVVSLLKNISEKSQKRLRDHLESKGITVRSYFIINALLVRGDLTLANWIASQTEVAKIVGNPHIRQVLPVPESPSSSGSFLGVEWGIQAIHADKVWQEYGVHGEGIVVASADTGVEWDHPALKGKYRGWNGTSADHSYNWHDSIEDRAEPIDDNDHGTHTTGTMTGDDGQGNQIGVAPGAKWIACRNMDHGVGTPARYIECNEFFLTPYPPGFDAASSGRADLAPHIINNSWGCPPSEGCDPDSLQESFANLNAAGIFPAVSAGNSGPFCSTVSDPPAIYGESFSVGATDSSTSLALFSSRGPVTVDGSNRLKPNISAPGVNVRSSVRNANYASFSGTSMAGPHVAGAVALLWAARPEMTGLIETTRCIIEASANPQVNMPWPQRCGDTGPSDKPNNLFGHGLVDALAAVKGIPDGDGDRMPDSCDCAPSNDTLAIAPPEVRKLEFLKDHETILWEDISPLTGSSTVFDLLRGFLNDLLSDGSISRASCLANNLPDAHTTDTENPSSGIGFYYLVRAQNGCGTGTLGADSAGNERTSSACP